MTHRHAVLRNGGSQESVDLPPVGWTQRHFAKSPDSKAGQDRSPHVPIRTQNNYHEACHGHDKANERDVMQNELKRHQNRTQRASQGLASLPSPVAIPSLHRTKLKT